VLVLATSYSGYLLPWDQDAYWTVTVGTSLVEYVPLAGEALKALLLGEATVGQAALTRFFVLHVALLPGAGALLLVIHLFRLRRAGGLARPAEAAGADEELVPASPHLTRRELALTLGLTAGLLALAVALPARLGPAANLLRPDNPPKAPWFLVGFQEMVSYSATVGGVVFPAVLALLLTLLPWAEGPGRNDGAFIPWRGERWALGGAVLLVIGSTVAAVLWWGDPQHGRASWINPASVGGLVALAVGAATGLQLRSRAAAARVTLAALVAGLVVLTAVGWFWRGPDWSLTYHPGPGHGLTRHLPASGPAAEGAGQEGAP
jgi:quinol-cytochrome oxidoreductase complex cytochrome b subunit